MTHRLEIIEYFDSVVNEIDLKAEILLEKIPECYHELVNCKRQLFLDEIEQTKAYNLSHLNEDANIWNKESLFKKYCFLVDMDKLNGHRFASFDRELFYQTRQANIKAEQFFKEMIDKDFGILIVVDGYLSDRKIFLFKDALRFQESYYPYEDDVDYKVDLPLDCYHVNRKLSDPKERNRYYIEKSNIFNSETYSDTQLYWATWLKFDIFNEVNSIFIIKNFNNKNL